jgi:hypothetical protein
MIRAIRNVNIFHGKVAASESSEKLFFFLFSGITGGWYFRSLTGPGTKILSMIQEKSEGMEIRRVTSLLFPPEQEEADKEE